MFKFKRLQAVIVSAAFCGVVPVVAHGQAPGGNRVTTEKTTVWIAEHSTADPSVWQRIGEFQSEDEADAAISAWQSRQFSSDYRLTRKRRLTKTTTFVAPTPPPTDGDSPAKTGLPGFNQIPGSIHGAKKVSSSSNVHPLAGKQFFGTIGSDQVTIKFNGTGERGGFVVSGALQGMGDWRQLGQFLQMETDFARYEGVIAGESISGTRTEIATGAKTNWTVSTRQPESDSGIPLSGTTWSLSNGEGGYLRFNANGSVSYFRYLGVAPNNSNGRFSQSGGSSSFSFRAASGSAAGASGTISGDKMTLTYSNGDVEFLERAH